MPQPTTTRGADAVPTLTPEQVGAKKAQLASLANLLEWMRCYGPEYVADQIGVSRLALFSVLLLEARPATQLYVLTRARELGWDVPAPAPAPKVKPAPKPKRKRKAV